MARRERAGGRCLRCGSLLDRIRLEQAGLVNVRAMQPYGHVYPFAQTELDRLAYHFDYEYADGRVPRTYAQPVLDAVDAWRACGFDALATGWRSTTPDRWRSDR